MSVWCSIILLSCLFQHTNWIEYHVSKCMTDHINRGRQVSIWKWYGIVDRLFLWYSLLANLQGEVIGITAKVEHPLPGCLSPLYDIFNKGKSILVVGPTGVGKTTLLREAARVLSDVEKKNVIIIDTLSEVSSWLLAVEDWLMSKMLLMQTLYFLN